MRIVYISEGNIPSLAANSIQVMKMSQALARLTSDFELCTAGDFYSIIARRRFNFERWYGIRRPFRIVRIPVLAFTRYPFEANFRPRSFPRYAAHYALLRRTSLIYTRSVPAAEIALRLGMNVVLETHAPISPEDGLCGVKIHTWCDNFLKLVTISDVLAEQYARAGVPEKKIIVAPDGVDLERFGTTIDKESVRRMLGLHQSAPIVVYAGHLYSHKGIPTLLEAARSLPGIFLVLVGGWEKDVAWCREEIKRMKLDNVKCVGFVPNEDVPLYLAAGDLCVMPYSSSVASAQWTSPMKMFEYLASRRPIVATRIPAVESVLSHGVNAFLVQPDDAVDLAKGIKTVLGNPGLGQMLATRGWIEVQKYSWDARAGRILEGIDRPYVRAKPGSEVGWRLFQSAVGEAKRVMKLLVTAKSGRA